MTVFLLCLALVAFLGVRGVFRFVKAHGVEIIILRLMTGRHHTGRHHTTATFWRDSNGKTLGTPSHHVMRRHHRAQYKNALRSICYLAVTGAIAFGLLNNFWLTAWLVAGLVALIVGYHVVKTVIRARHWYENKPVVAPLSKALSGISGLHEADMEKAIRLNPGYLKIKDGELGVVYFPDGFHADEAEKETVQGLISRRFPVPVDFIWHTTKNPQYLTIMAAPPMPEMIPFDDVIPELRALPADEILLGKTAKSVSRTWDMGSEEPMAFVSATTRRGKTTLAMLIMAQILNKGGYVTAIDPKAIGLDEFCAGHPNAKVYADNTDIASMWAGIREFRQELNERIEAYKLDRTLTFPRKTLILDEVSVFNALSVEHWEQIRPPGSKKVPAIWSDIMAIVFTGGQFNVNACLFGQRVDFRTLGGLIDGFGTRILAGYTRQTYARLIGILPVPLSQKPRGRFLMYANGDEYPEWIQVPYGSIQEMRDYALESVKGRNASMIVQGKVIDEKEIAA